MKLIDPIRTLGRNLLDLVFPVICLGCGKEESGYLCPECRLRLPREQKQLCVRCRQLSPFGKTHPSCASRNFPDGLISPLPYPSPLVKKIIETFKYNFVSSLDQTLAEIIIEELDNQELKNYLSSFTIIPVPLHRRRYRWRGFNQAELLGKKLTLMLAGSKIDAGLVRRTRFTKPQVKLDANQRESNIKGAFALTRPSMGRYLIVDDVVTSGSTINEIARTLKKGGASQVWAATAARG